MSELQKSIRLSKAAIEFNVGKDTIVDFLNKKGIKIESNPNAKLSPEAYALLEKEYQTEKHVKEISKKIELEFPQYKSLSIELPHPENEEQKPKIKKKTTEVKNVEENVKEEDIKDADKNSGKLKPKVKTATTKTRKEKHPKIVEFINSEASPSQVKEDTVTVVKTDSNDDSITQINANIITESKVNEKPIETIGNIKILGKIDLSELMPSRKKTKVEKSKPTKRVKPTKTVKEDTEATTPIIPKETSKSKEVEDKKEDAFKEDTVEVILTDTIEQSRVDDTNKTSEDAVAESNFLKTEVRKLEGPTIIGSMKLPEPKKVIKKPVASSTEEPEKSKKKRRKRIKKNGLSVKEDDKNRNRNRVNEQQSKLKSPKPKKAPKVKVKPEVSEEDIQKQIKETLQRLSSSSSKSKASKHRKEKRILLKDHLAEEAQKLADEEKTIKVTEFVTANELAKLMNIPINQVISTCMSLGLTVSINQRLDAETIILVADEFEFSVAFVDADVSDSADTDDVDSPEDLQFRSPIVTVMGHVDHGKTSLLDYIRNANVIAGEAGGITQHIGAYEVKLDNGRSITFLDTPGHEAFTAMRARGAKITDIVIIVVAADDTVMPQTVEAINHAQAAGVPIVFAINKIDKPNANPEKIKEELSKRNILVEDWGGKYQSQEISAKKGNNVDLLLEKVLLEAELLDLKANPNKRANGVILESSLDKGRGYVSNILVQSGSLKVGDIVLAGTTYGKVKAMYNERNKPMKTVGPSQPSLLLGLNGAPQAGDAFKVMEDEREAKNIATKRQQLIREQGIRTQKHITLDEIGRRIAIGEFKELNIIVKGDMDGSVEALSDSLLRLSTPEVQVNTIHKSVGAITESDVLLASASNAIIVGFQVRPSLGARKLAEQEQIDIRTYSIIYTAINEIKAAIEGMLSPDIEEKILCNIEVREVFKISKVGTIAGCMVLDGKVQRNTRIRIIRDGIVIYTGTLGSLKRFKDDVKEVSAGYECGLNIDNFNDIKVNDIIEGYEEIEVKRKLN